MDTHPCTVCVICGSLTTPMRPSVCLDCHELTITIERTGRYTSSRGWTRHQWCQTIPAWWQQRLDFRTRSFVRLLADTPLRDHNSAPVERVADALNMPTVDTVGRLLMRAKEASVIDLTVTYPRAFDDDISGDHGPDCGCKRWTMRLRPRPPAPDKPRRTRR